MKKEVIKSFTLILVCLVLFSCADVEQIDECIESTPYGFFSGLWHGMICSISFIVSLFNDNVAIYAVNNTGGWYDFGFCIGAGIFFSGSSKAT